MYRCVCVCGLEVKKISVVGKDHSELKKLFSSVSR